MLSQMPSKNLNLKSNRILYSKVILLPPTKMGRNKTLINYIYAFILYLSIYEFVKLLIFIIVAATNRIASDIFCNLKYSSSSAS